MRKRAAIYARVSSQKQKKEETIDSQVQVLKQFGNQEGYQIPDNFVFLDNGVSGKGLNRPGLDELREVIRTEPLEAVLMYAPDRLARSYPHQLILLEEFRKHGVKVHFLKGAPEGNTPEAIMFNHFQGIFAEYERALILDRSRRGRIYKAKQGDPSILPDIPFGYRRAKTGRKVIVEVVDNDAAVVKSIFRFYVHECLPLSAICRRLAENGILTPNGNVRWDRATIRDILRNPAYTGSAYYGKTERCEGVSNKIRHYAKGKWIKAKYARTKLPEEKWIPISIPAIISESDFQLAQEQANKNKAMSIRNTKNPSLLQGLVVCGECSYPFYKRFRRARNTSCYMCRSHNDSRLKKCSNGSIPQRELDELVYNEILQLLQNPAIIRQELERRANESKDSEEAVQKALACKKELHKLVQERDRLLDAYQSGFLDLKELGQRNQKLDKMRDEIEKEIQGLQALQLRNELGSSWENFFDSILARMKKSATELSFQEKQQLIRLLVEKVVINRGTVKIVHCISPQLLCEENVPLSLGDGCKPTVTGGNCGVRE